MNGDLLVFTATCLAAALAPGPSLLGVVQQSALAGLRRTVPMMLGVLLGLLILAAFALAGVGVLVQTVPEWFLALRILGALYIAQLGVRTFLAKDTMDPSSKPKCNTGAFSRGVLLTVSNPKAIGYFSALFVPFIDPNQPVAVQFFKLCTIMLLASAVSLALYGAAGARAGALLARHRKRFNKVMGTTFVAYGAAMLSR